MTKHHNGKGKDKSPLTTIIGRLEELNGHDGLTGRLWESDGTKWLCRFRADHMPLISMAWMRTAKIIGRTVQADGAERAIDVESLVLLEEPGAEARPPAASFWHSQSLDELAAQQGISAVSDLDAISAFWPADDEAEELLRHVMNERRLRRSLPKKDAL